MEASELDVYGPPTGCLQQFTKEGPRSEVEKGLADGSVDRAAAQASAVRILNATLNGMKHGSQSVVPAPRRSSKIKDEQFVLKPEARIGWQGENAREMA